VLDEHLVDVEALFDVVDATNVDLIICGHQHSSFEDEVNGVPVACVGGFMDEDGHALVVDTEDGSELDWFWWLPEEWK
jgi:2',3'-cyclic-nucleotide 2'-phosphodiesterase (5'-nucleotidase family)